MCSASDDGGLPVKRLACSCSLCGRAVTSRRTDSQMRTHANAFPSQGTGCLVNGDACRQRVSVYVSLSSSLITFTRTRAREMQQMPVTSQMQSSCSRFSGDLPSLTLAHCECKRVFFTLSLSVSVAVTACVSACFHCRWPVHPVCVCITSPACRCRSRTATSDNFLPSSRLTLSLPLSLPATASMMPGTLHSLSSPPLPSLLTHSLPSSSSVGVADRCHNTHATSQMYTCRRGIVTRTSIRGTACIASCLAISLSCLSLSLLSLTFAGP